MIKVVTQNRIKCFLISTPFPNLQLIANDTIYGISTVHISKERQLEQNNAIIKLHPLVQKHNYSELDDLSTRIGIIHNFGNEIKHYVQIQTHQLCMYIGFTQCKYINLLFRVSPKQNNNNSFGEGECIYCLTRTEIHLETRSLASLFG